MLIVSSDKAKRREDGQHVGNTDGLCQRSSVHLPRCRNTNPSMHTAVKRRHTKPSRSVANSLPEHGQNVLHTGGGPQPPFRGLRPMHILQGTDTHTDKEKK